MLNDKISRRALLRLSGVGLGAAVLAACQPKVIEVTKVVEKEVEKVVPETGVVAGTLSRRAAWAWSAPCTPTLCTASWTRTPTSA